MKVTYKNKKVEQLSDKNYLKSKYSNSVAKNIEWFLDVVRASPNLFFVQAANRGMHIEKLKSKQMTYSVRINKSYRIEFTVNNEKIIEIISIEITRVHNHKYQ